MSIANFKTKKDKTLECLEEEAWFAYDNPNSSEEEVKRAQKTLQMLGALPR